MDADVISKIFSDDTFGLERAKNNDEDDDEEGMESIPVIPTAHASDAVDYSDFDETVPDDQQEKYYRRGMGMLQKNLKRSRLALVSDNYDDDEEEEEIKPMMTATPINAPIPVEKPDFMDIDQKKVDIQQLFPGFEKGKILKFSELFMAKIKRPPKLQLHKKGIFFFFVIKRKCITRNSTFFFLVVFGDGYEYEVERDERILFLRASKLDRLRAEQAKTPVKRRRAEILNENSESSSNESEDEDYLQELAERV